MLTTKTTETSMAVPNDSRRKAVPPQTAGTQRPHIAAADTPELNPQQPMQRNRRPNRRIIESDDDDDAAQVQEDSGAADAVAIAGNDLMPPRDGNDPIVIHTSDDDDDMWLRPLNTQNDQSMLRGRNALAQQEPTPRMPRAVAPRFRRRRPASPDRRCSSRSRFDTEAEERMTPDDSDDDSANWVCTESDTDADDLFRSAVAGVRNASNARQQWRAATTPCPVCAQFASFLQHFM